MLLPDNKSATSIPPPPYSPSAAAAGGPVPLSASPTSAAPSSVPSMTPSALPAQNHVHIRRDNTPIHGSFLIDVSLPGGTGKNLSLESHNGLVDANVWVKGEAKRCEIEAVSHNGVVRLGVADRETPIPLRILAKTHNGTVHLLLPLDFEGPLTIVHQNGAVAVLPPLSEHARLISDEGGVRKYWIGSEEAQEEAEQGEWLGDQAWGESMNGTVSVGYWAGGAQEKEQEEAKEEEKVERGCGIWRFMCP